MKRLLLLLIPTGFIATSCQDEYASFDAFVENGIVTDSTCVPDFCWNFVYPLDVVFDGDTLELTAQSGMDELFIMCCENDSLGSEIDTLSQGTGTCDHGDSTAHNDNHDHRGHKGERERKGGKDKHRKGHKPPCVEVLVPFNIYNLDGNPDTVTVSSPKAVRDLVKDCVHQE